MKVLVVLVLVIMVVMVMVMRMLLVTLVMIKVTSTLSTLTPRQGSVPSSRTVCISRAIDSRPDKISPRVFVPNTFLAKNCSQRDTECSNSTICPI